MKSSRGYRDPLRVPDCDLPKTVHAWPSGNLLSCRVIAWPREFDNETASAPSTPGTVVFKFLSLASTAIPHSEGVIQALFR